MMDGLMSAAILAGKLSQSRRQKIRLLLGASGLLVEGRLYDERGERELYMQSFAVSWEQIYNEFDLEPIIRRIDADLTAQWRTEAA